MTDIILTNQPLSQTACMDFVAQPESGGVCVFTGNVRNKTKGKPVLRLEYEAYAPMAYSEMQKIADSIVEKWPNTYMAIHHRTGTLQIGEAAVIIAISAPHRGAAFEACQYAIDTLKETVPIWKKEIFEDGEVWVSAFP